MIISYTNRMDDNLPYYYFIRSNPSNGHLKNLPSLDTQILMDEMQNATFHLSSAFSNNQL